MKTFCIEIKFPDGGKIQQLITSANSKTAIQEYTKLNGKPPKESVVTVTEMTTAEFMLKRS